MAKEGINSRSPRTGRFVTVRTHGATRGARVKFGSVTISGAKPAAAKVDANVAFSTAALERVTKTLSKPGVVLRPKKDVPLFSASEGERGVFIRRLNGRVERGHMVDGAFQVID
jgi:hypothetical protein